MNTFIPENASTGNMGHAAGGLFCILLTVPLFAGDVRGVLVAKDRLYYQHSDAPPLEADASFGFRTQVEFMPPDGILEATVLPPGRFEWWLGSDLRPEVLEHADTMFDTQGALDADYPEGVYTVAIETLNEGRKEIVLELTGGAYPSGTPPTFLDFESLEAVPADGGFVLSWQPFGGAGPGDFVQVEVANFSPWSMVFHTPDPWDPGAMPASATSVTIPAGTFSPGDLGLVWLTFGRVMDTEDAQISGARGVAVFTQRTEAYLTVVEGSGTDTTAPTLAGAQPESGAQHVPTTAAVSFVFSEPMAASQAILWGGGLTDDDFDYAWSTDRLTLVCKPVSALPDNTTITWALNPSGMAGGFADLTGNLLPANTCSGEFTTRINEDGAGQTATSPELDLEVITGPPNALTLRVRGTNLKGFLIQGATDMERWYTLDTVPYAVTSYEFSVPVTDVAKYRFYRAIQFSAAPQITMDPAQRVSALVPPTGGELRVTSLDGATYTLSIPAGALFAPETITLTPILSMDPFPLSGGMKFGIQLEPDGLMLWQAATLTVGLPTAVNIADFVAFSGDGEGVNLSPFPAQFVGDLQVVMDVTHFSVYAGGAGPARERGILPYACDALKVLGHQIAMLLEGGVMPENFHEDAQGYCLLVYTNMILPNLEAAVQNDRLTECAVHDWFQWASFVAGFGLNDEAISVQLPEVGVRALNNAVEQTVVRCETTGELSELARLFALGGMQGLLGVANPDNVIPRFMNCFRFRLEFRSELSWGDGDNADRGRSIVEETDLILTTQDLSHLSGHGTNLYQLFELERFPCGEEFPHRSKQAHDGVLSVPFAWIYRAAYQAPYCRCEPDKNQQEDPDEESLEMRITLLLEPKGPRETYDEVRAEDFDPNCLPINLTYVPMQTCLWSDVFFVKHREELAPEVLGGTQPDPSVPVFLGCGDWTYVIQDFTIMNEVVEGKRKLAEKRYERPSSGHDDWVTFDENTFYDIQETTVITLWHEPIRDE